MNVHDRIEESAPPSGSDLPKRSGQGAWKGRRVALAVGLIGALVAAVLLGWPRPDPDQLWRAAQLDLSAGRIDEAERAVERIARVRPMTDADRMLRAQVAIAQDRIDEALAILERFPDESPLAPQAHLLAGQLELRRDRLRVAEEHFQRALGLDPGLEQARRELIFIYGYQSRSDDIEDQFQHLSESRTLSYGEAFLWSLIRGVQWSPEEIVETLSRAVEQDPEDRQSRIALADALMELNRFDEAEDVLDPLDPVEPDSIAALGRLALERGDVGTLRALLADAPESHAGLSLLRGKLALQLRDPEAAIAAYRRALELRPNDRDALSGLSQALNQAGRRDEAAEVVERLNRVNALNNLLNESVKVDATVGSEQYVEFGAACEAVGFRSQARAWYQVAIAADPFNRQAQHALARLGRPGDEDDIPDRPAGS